MIWPNLVSNIVWIGVGYCWRYHRYNCDKIRQYGSYDSYGDGFSYYLKALKNLACNDAYLYP
jgi:hypothetical protein